MVVVVSCLSPGGFVFRVTMVEVVIPDVELVMFDVSMVVMTLVDV